MFEGLGGFDERLFMYFEEVDLSLRARQRGLRTQYLSDARAIHTAGGVTRQVISKRLSYSLRSRVQYCWKHFGPFGFATVFLATLLIEPVARAVFRSGSRSSTPLRDIWAAYRSFVEWLPEWVMKGRPR
jgi:GT2 family glycosyltransferase